MVLELLCEILLCEMNINFDVDLYLWKYFKIYLKEILWEVWLLM